MILFLLACALPEKLEDILGEVDETAPTTSGSAAGPLIRGVWAWQDSGDPYGTLAVVGDSAAEDAMIADLIDWQVGLVYGSYGDRPITEPAVIAAWNVKLHDAGVESHVLMGDPSWISSREWSGMEEDIEGRLLSFNAGQSDPQARFDGLHLDIEPQATADWDTQDEDTKYAYLGLLASTYVFARGVVDDEDPSLPIAADLAVWFDNLPADLGGTGSVGWPSVPDRDAWFIDLDLDGISMMAYERDDLLDIVDDVSGELTLFPGALRVGLNEEVGTTWADIDEMFEMAEALEDDGYAVDLHSYSEIRAQLP